MIAETVKLCPSIFHVLFPGCHKTNFSSTTNLKFLSFVKIWNATLDHTYININATDGYIQLIYLQDVSTIQGEKWYMTSGKHKHAVCELLGRMLCIQTK